MTASHFRKNELFGGHRQRLAAAFASLSVIGAGLAGLAGTADAAVTPIPVSGAKYGGTATKVLSGNLTFPEGFTVPAGEIWELDSRKSTTIESKKNIVVKGILRTRPASNRVNHTVRFVGVDENKFVGGGMIVQPSDVGLWVMGTGQLDAAGSKKLAWGRVVGALAKGATTITLDQAPVGWKVGDEIGVTPTADANSGAAWLAYDYATVKAIAGNTITLSTPLAQNHPMVNGKWTAEVLNYSRNVNIGGSAAGRSHIFIGAIKPQRIDYVDIRHVGPRPISVKTARPVGAEPKWPSAMETFGRYGIHFHMGHDSQKGSTVNGTVVRDAGNHAFVAHMSNGITFDSTISHNTISDAYWWDGPRLPAGCNLQNWRTCHLVADASLNNVYRNCVASAFRGQPNGNAVRNSGFELGKGEGNSMRGCLAVGGSGSTDSNGFEWPEATDGLWDFDNNMAHNNAASGIFSWQNSGKPHTITNFVAYNNSIGIEHGAYKNKFLYSGGELFANKHAGIQLHGVTQATQGAQPLRFQNFVIDGGGVGYTGIESVHHNLDSNQSTDIRKMTFKNFTGPGAIVLNNKGTRPDLIDISYSTFQGNPFYIKATPAHSKLRVQPTDKSAYEVLRADQQGTAKPAWNATSNTIAPFTTNLNIIPPKIPGY